jgi:hypothetical protein
MWVARGIGSGTPGSTGRRRDTGRPPDRRIGRRTIGRVDRFRRHTIARVAAIDRRPLKARELATVRRMVKAREGVIVRRPIKVRELITAHRRDRVRELITAHRRDRVRELVIARRRVTVREVSTVRRVNDALVAFPEGIDERRWWCRTTTVSSSRA